MGNYISGEKLKTWLRKNWWTQERTNKHEVWILEIIDDSNGNILIFDTVTLNFHRRKGQGMSESDIKKIANSMKLNKESLIQHVRDKENIDIEIYKK